MFTFTQSVVTSKNVSQGTHHVRKSSSFSTYAFNCRHAQLRTELREEAWFRGYERAAATADSAACARILGGDEKAMASSDDDFEPPTKRRKASQSVVSLCMA